MSNPTSPLMPMNPVLVYVDMYPGYSDFVLCGSRGSQYSACSGAIAIRFSVKQTLIGLWIVGGMDASQSSSRFRFFDDSGSLLGQTEVTHTSQFMPLAMSAGGGSNSFSGILITNNDSFGAGYDQFLFSSVAPATVATIATTQQQPSNTNSNSNSQTQYSETASFNTNVDDSSSTNSNGNQTFIVWSTQPINTANISLPSSNGATTTTSSSSAASLHCRYLIACLSSFIVFVN